ncbi:MAG: hypothetical protein ACE5GT_00390 [Rhodospirillales bacterium]
MVERHGLGAEEYRNVLANPGRRPSITEFGIFSAMWSEHCSHKSAKIGGTHAVLLAESGSTTNRGER